MRFYLIDKSLSHRHSCRAVAGKHHSDFIIEFIKNKALPYFYSANGALNSYETR